MFTQTGPSLFLFSTAAGILAPAPNGTNDTANLQATLNAVPAAGGTVILQPGVYLINSTLTYPGNCNIIGAGAEECIIRVIAATSLTTPILASKDWFNNATTSGNPVHISGLTLDGNSAMSGSGGHGLVSMNFWSSFDDLAIKNVSGDGFLFTRQNQAGTNISNTCVEPKIRRLQVRSPGGIGIHIQDNAVGGNACTDGFLEDCIVQNAGSQSINVEMGPGWHLIGNHTYGSVTDAIVVSNCYGTRIIGNYVDGYGSGASSFIAGLSLALSSSARQSICMGNTVNFDTGTASGTYQAIRVSGPSAGNNTMHVIGNVVNGGGQVGSLGYVFQATSGHAWTINAHDNNVTGAQSGNGFFIDGNTTVQTFQSQSTFASAQSGSAPDPGAGGTVATTGVGMARVNPAAARTLCVLAVGATAGQELWVVNEAASGSGFSISWATQATSNIAGEAGGTFVLAAKGAQKFVWSTGDSLWHKAA